MTTDSVTRRVSDAEYVARYTNEVQQRAMEELRDLPFSAGGWLLRANDWAQVISDDMRLMRSLDLYRHRLETLTGSATLYTLDAAGKRTEWRPEK